jgi:hypothetical protein
VKARLPSIAVLVLLAVMGMAIFGVQTLDRRAGAVEASVRRYADAVSNADLDAAMAEIAPPERARWREWVAGQLGNVYEVRGIAVRSPSILAAPAEVTVAMDVNRDYPDVFYQPTPRVGVEEVDGREYLSAPLLSS